MTCHLTVLLIVLPVVTALLGQFLQGETLVDSPWHNVMTPTMLVTFYISHLKERERFLLDLLAIFLPAKETHFHKRTEIIGASRGLWVLQKMQFQEEKNSGDQ